MRDDFECERTAFKGRPCLTLNDGCSVTLGRYGKHVKARHSVPWGLIWEQNL